MIPAAHVIFVLDDSGSMNGSASITKKAFDGMVESLQLCKGADIVMSLIKYGSQPNVQYKRQHIQEVQPVKYNPNSGYNAIYDSVRLAIKIAGEAPREEKTIIILQADGDDGHSSSSNPNKVREELLAAKKKGVEFLFLGANYNEQHGLSREMMAYYEKAHGGLIATKRFIMNCAKLLGFAESEVMFYNSNATQESLVAFSETATNIGSVASRLTEHAAFTADQQNRVKKG